MSATLSLTADAVEAAVRAHLVKAVGEVRLESDPFSHIYMESAFPADLYPVMLDALPKTSLYTPDNPRKYGQQATARPPSRMSSSVEGVHHVSSSRYTFPLNTSSLARLPD